MTLRGSEAGMGHSLMISAPDHGVGSADPGLEDAQRVEAASWKPSAAGRTTNTWILLLTAFSRK